MSLETSSTYLIAIFIFAITPGPGTFALLARALSSSASACLSMALGMAISDIIYLSLATLGLASIAENYNGLFTLIRFIGAAYLFYLGWKMWSANVNTTLEGQKIKDKYWISGFIQGFLISASNPKVILFYIAFLPTFIDLTVLTRGDLVWVSTLTFIGLMTGFMMVALGASSVRKHLKSSGAIKALNRTAGSIMIGAGAFLVYSGSRQS